MNEYKHMSVYLPPAELAKPFNGLVQPLICMPASERRQYLCNNNLVFQLEHDAIIKWLACEFLKIPEFANPIGSFAMSGKIADLTNVTRSVADIMPFGKYSDASEGTIPVQLRSDLDPTASDSMRVSDCRKPTLVLYHMLQSSGIDGVEVRSHFSGYHCYLRVPPPSYGQQTNENPYKVEFLASPQPNVACSVLRQLDSEDLESEQHQTDVVVSSEQNNVLEHDIYSLGYCVYKQYRLYLKTHQDKEVIERVKIVVSDMIASCLDMVGEAANMKVHNKKLKEMQRELSV